MQITQGSTFSAERAWGKKNITNMQGISVNLHWTNKAYNWHVNDGKEVFVVIKGQVKMYYKEAADTRFALLNEGDIYSVEQGEEHMAEPIGEARVLVIEKQGSV
jgi:mannose-6-phosphate isomerase-like protein (cupin superfamily)